MKRIELFILFIFSLTTLSGCFSQKEPPAILPPETTYENPSKVIFDETKEPLDLENDPNLDHETTPLGTPVAQVNVTATSEPTKNIVPTVDQSVPNQNQAVYVVQSGDTLFSIARKYGTNVDAIRAANPSLSNSDVIYVGQEIILPNGQKVPQPATEPPPSTWTPTAVIPIATPTDTPIPLTKTPTAVFTTMTPSPTATTVNPTLTPLSTQTATAVPNTPTSTLPPPTETATPTSEPPTVTPTIEETTLPAPTGVFNLTALPQSGTTVLLQWYDIMNEDGYNIYIKAANETDWRFIGTAAADQTRQRITELQPSTEYQFYLQAFNNSGAIDSNVVSVLTHSVGGTLKIINETHYDLMDIRINGQQQLQPGYVILPNNNGSINNLEAGTYNLYIGIGVANDEWWNYSNISITIIDGQTTTYSVGLPLDQMLAGEWRGVEPASLLDDCPTEHYMNIGNNNSFQRSLRGIATDCKWASVQSGALIVTSWPTYSSIISFSLNGQQDCMVSYPFGTVYCYISVYGGSMQLNKQ